jgi:hypothetical protein
MLFTPPLRTSLKEKKRVLVFCNGERPGAKRSAVIVHSLKEKKHGARRGKARHSRTHVRESTRPVLAGLLAGLVLAVGAPHLLRGVLYGLSIVDGISFASVSILFLAIALVAVYLPSRRAMNVEPMVALRYQVAIATLLRKPSIWQLIIRSLANRRSIPGPSTR